MPTSAAGSKPRSLRGFTLIELLVVVAIIAIASAGVVFAVRDSAGNQLEREALRLASLLEAGRAQSRGTGQPVRWQALENGFRFEGSAQGSLPDHWLSPGIQVHGTQALLLGPEPLIGAQALELESTALPGRRVRVATDGLRPFRVEGLTP